MTGGPDAATYFGRRTTLYDGRYEARDADGHALRARMAVVLKALGEGPGNLLDAGMGPGRLCIAVASRGWSVTGVDASAEMVEAARERLPAEAEKLLQASIEALPFGAETFDAVAATGVLEYVELHRALGELERVLRAGGVLVVSYPNPRSVYGIWKAQVYYRLVRAVKRVGRRPYHWMPRGGRTVAPARFVELLRAHRLEVESVDYASYLALPSPLDVLLPRLAWRFGRALEGRGGPLAPVLATQIVYVARKPLAVPPTEVVNG